MWFEIIPPAAIIFACLTLPQGYCYVANRLSHHGNPYQRGLAEIWQRAGWHRDCRITGDPYKTQGLEAIPDE